jgi:hypothetical protein
MRIITHFLLALASIVVGLVIGYLLRDPIWRMPVEATMQFLSPILAPIHEFTSSRDARYLMLALVEFLVSLPNTLVISVLAAMLIEKFTFKRLAFYSVFLFPALMQVLHWLRIWRLDTGAGHLALPLDLATRHIYHQYLASEALLMLVTYTTFAAILLTIRTRFRTLHLSHA